MRRFGGKGRHTKSRPGTFRQRAFLPQIPRGSHWICTEAGSCVHSFSIATSKVSSFSDALEQLRTRKDPKYFPFGRQPFLCCSAWIEFISFVSETLGRKVATLCAGIMSDSPVLKFHPLRESLLRTVNLPKPRMMIGFPFRRVALRNSRNLSSSLTASVSEIPLLMCFRLEPVV